MTVKSLTDATKKTIAFNFQTGKCSLDRLAVMYSRSRGTIIRVLEEQGVKGVVKKRVPKPKPAPLQVPVVIPTKTPWWKRIFTREAIRL